jgi:hypothetical protein
MAQIEKPVFKDDTYYPPAQSAAGTNAYYMDYCAAGGCRPGYAVCLNKVAAVEEGRMPSVFSGCTTAIEGKTCPALSMRAQEQLEGRAMFYIDRAKQLEFFNAQAKAPITSAFLDELKAASKEARAEREAKKGATPPPVTKTAPQVTPSVVVGSGGYADALTAAVTSIMVEAAERSKAKTQLPVMPTPTPAAAVAAEPPRATIAPPKMLPGETMLDFAKRVRALKEKEAAQTTH